MVRNPLTPEQIAAGRRLGARLRELRGARALAEVAVSAGISPETLRKIETGRMPTPAFATIAALARSLNTSLDDLALVFDDTSLDDAVLRGSVLRGGVARAG